MRIIIITLLLTFLSGSILSQIKDNIPRGVESVYKIGGIEDRAVGTHNASNIGLFFENRGKLYPRRATDGPSGEFPINSGKNYIYRIAPFVGIPDNVVQSRHTGNEEWEAVGGFHNDEFAQIAFSDNPQTWPQDNGWPVKDENGDPIILSDQDSYCVFADSNNSREILGLHLAQTGYAYGVEFAENIIFYKYDLWNEGDRDLQDVYFAMYTDIDVGNVSGGDPEYEDDFIDFDKENNFLYFYDDGVSDEWPDGKTGHFGLTFLKTPEVNGDELGVTDMHYYLWFDDENNDFDTLQYGIMSSDQDLYNSNVGSRYFHLGDNFPDLHYDDPSTIRSSGDDLVATVSSGPYILTRNDTLTFYIAIIGGENKDDLYTSLDVAQKALEFNFELAKPPLPPNLSADAGDRNVILYWDDISESSFDNFSQENDFEGYRIYRSRDKGISWTQLGDYNVNSSAGLQYSYTDSSVTNGFEYWYSVTAYDRGNEELASLESPKGKTAEAPNLVAVTPQSAASGYIPVSGGNIEYTGTGETNYILNVQPVSDEKLAGNTYEIGFSFVSRNIGTLNTKAEFSVLDSSMTNMDGWSFNFLNERSFELTNLRTDELVFRNNPTAYVPGFDYEIIDGVLAVRFVETTEDPFFRPKAGDRINIYFGSNVVKNSADTVIESRRFEIDQMNSTPDGVVFQVKKPKLIEDVSNLSSDENLNITFSIGDESELLDQLYLISVLSSGNSGTDSAYVEISVVSESGDTAYSASKLRSFETFTFNGINGNINFDNNSPPENGAVYSVSSIVPKPPNLKDRFRFSINPSSVSREIISDEISNIKVVPNPYVAASLYEPEYGELRREPERQIQFINLPNECDIFIYTVDADLVKTIKHSSFSGTAIWDLKGEGGREVAPGIFIYVVKSGDSEYMSRFAIIK